MDGFLLIDKPKGMTSQDVVARLKKKLELRRCGHTGTLDPDATGLLVVACDSATKLIRLLDEPFKQYQAKIVFGYASNTLDVYGTITDDIEMNFTLEELDQTLKSLKDQTEQIPPMVSAIKVAGKKLYEYERKNEKPSINPRPIRIENIKRVSDLISVDGHLEVELVITCSKGFYVRSFARDLGQALGGIAILKDLRRLQSGPFHLKDAVPLEEAEERNLLSIEAVFPHFGRLEVNDFTANLVKNGVILDERQIKTKEPFYILYNGVIIAIYEVIGEYQYKPVVIFKER